MQERKPLFAFPSGIRNVSRRCNLSGFTRARLYCWRGKTATGQGLMMCRNTSPISAVTSSNNTYLNGCSVNLACPVCLLGYQVAEHILLTSLKWVFSPPWNYSTKKKKKKGEKEKQQHDIKQTCWCYVSTCKPDWRKLLSSSCFLSYSLLTWFCPSVLRDAYVHSLCYMCDIPFFHLHWLWKCVGSAEEYGP